MESMCLLCGNKIFQEFNFDKLSIRKWRNFEFAHFLRRWRRWHHSPKLRKQSIFSMPYEISPIELMLFLARYFLYYIAGNNWKAFSFRMSREGERLRVRKKNCSFRFVCMKCGCFQCSHLILKAQFFINILWYFVNQSSHSGLSNIGWSINKLFSHHKCCLVFCRAKSDELPEIDWNYVKCVFVIFSSIPSLRITVDNKCWSVQVFSLLSFNVRR